MLPEAPHQSFGTIERSVQQRQMHPMVCRNLRKRFIITLDSEGGRECFIGLSVANT